MACSMTELMPFCTGEIFCTYSVTRGWIGLTSYVLVDKIAVFEVTLHIGDTNEVTMFIVSADLEKVFLPFFSSEIVGITLNSYPLLPRQWSEDFMTSSNDFYALHRFADLRS